MRLGYNTNGFAHHRLPDAVEILAELGYHAVALTPDVNHLDIFTTTVDDWRRFGELVQRHGLTCVVETGSRFLLDARRKHQPTLLSATLSEQAVRLDFLRRCLQLAEAVNADVISFWSGTPTDDVKPSEHMQRLVENCRRITDEAAERQIRVAFEPEPGMFLDTMDKFAELHGKVNHPNFGLTIDVGHLVCLGEVPIREHLLRWQKQLGNIHLDDMKPGVHDHLMFGEGVVNFDELFTTLREIGFSGVASVELSRHSYDAVNTAKKSRDFLRSYTSTLG